MFDHVRSGFYLVVVGCFVFERGPNIRVMTAVRQRKKLVRFDAEGMHLLPAYYVPHLISTTKTVGLV